VSASTAIFETLISVGALPFWPGMFSIGRPPSAKTS
jgi:hypothetical protein